MYQFILAASELFGASFRGEYAECLCPFHNDTHPSLKIYADGKWRCYPCGIGGSSIIQLVSKVYGINDLEALDILAPYWNRGDVDIPVSDKEVVEQKNKKDVLLAQDIWNDVITYKGVVTRWQNIMVSEQHYLLTRGFLSDTLEHYHVAIVPSTYYPIFIPLAFNQEVYGYVLRCKGYSINPKYKTMHGFSKSRHIYGQAVKGCSELLVTEGRLDGMMAYQYGVLNEISILGSNVSDTQVQLIRELEPRMIVAGFDNDRAGRKAYQELCKKVPEYPVVQLQLPKKDIAACGKDEFLRVFEKARNSSTFVGKNDMSL